MQKKVISTIKKGLSPLILTASLILTRCAVQAPLPNANSEKDDYARMGRLILPAELFDSKENLIILGNSNPITVRLNPFLQHPSVLLKITDLKGRAFYDRPLFGKLYMFAKEPEDVLSYINMTVEGLPNDVMVLPLNMEFKILIEHQQKVIFEKNFKIEE